MPEVFLPYGNDVSRPPIAAVKLPFAMPMAFHGSWMAGQGDDR